MTFLDRLLIKIALAKLVARGGLLELGEAEAALEAAFRRINLPGSARTS